MTRDELRAAARELVRLHERFAPLFGRRETQEHAEVYVRGLLLAEGRKSVEPMALVFQGEDHVLDMQRFLTRSPWSAEQVQRELQQVFVEALGPSTTQ